jgi:hypothetical protein
LGFHALSCICGSFLSLLHLALNVLNHLLVLNQRGIHHLRGSTGLTRLARRRGSDCGLARRGCAGSGLCERGSAAKTNGDKQACREQQFHVRGHLSSLGINRSWDIKQRARQKQRAWFEALKNLDAFTNSSRSAGVNRGSQALQENNEVF